MPNITSPPATILVTGANGFVGSWVVDTLIKRGYLVRAVVRSISKGQFLVEKYGADNVTLYVVENMEKEGAYDEAVKGVEGIIHCASPLVMAVEPEDIINPAVNGVLGIMRSAMKYGTLVKRVVLTSSGAAVVQLFNDDDKHTVSEKDWNLLDIGLCEKEGKEASYRVKYRASKVLAEQAAWSFYEENEVNLKWDLCVIIPPAIFGPAIHPCTFETASMSYKFWYGGVIEGKFTDVSSPLKFMRGSTQAWADCRDVAEAHVRALEVSEAGGERVLISASSGWVWQDWLDIATALAPSLYTRHPVQTGEKGVAERVITIDTSKEKRLFGLKYRSMEETTSDILKDLELKGW